MVVLQFMSPTYSCVRGKSHPNAPLLCIGCTVTRNSALVLYIIRFGTCVRVGSGVMLKNYNTNHQVIMYTYIRTVFYVLSFQSYLFL